MDGFTLPCLPAWYAVPGRGRVDDVEDPLAFQRVSLTSIVRKNRQNLFVTYLAV